MATPPATASEPAMPSQQIADRTDDPAIRLLDTMPLVAILRGLEPGQADDVASLLLEAGFRALEVPLNSPQPFASIERIARRFSTAALVGAGTVLRAEDVARVAAAGGRLLVTPHFDPAIVAAAGRPASSPCPAWRRRAKPLQPWLPAPTP
jgi:2-dehydro-3-deoxyphosphogalactonate aldolase